MPETKNIRAKTCGYCGKKLGSFYYRDLTRARGYFCSGDHCMKFIENNNQPMVPGLKEDETQSVMDVHEAGYEGYEDRDSKKSRVVTEEVPVSKKKAVSNVPMSKRVK